MEVGRRGGRGGHLLANPKLQIPNPKSQFIKSQFIKSQFIKSQFIKSQSQIEIAIENEPQLGILDLGFGIWDLDFSPTAARFDIPAAGASSATPGNRRHAPRQR